MPPGLEELSPLGQAAARGLEGNVGNMEVGAGVRRRRGRGGGKRGGRKGAGAAVAVHKRRRSMLVRELEIANLESGRSVGVRT
jgi:hypothetical protein